MKIKLLLMLLFDIALFCNAQSNVVTGPDHTMTELRNIIQNAVDSKESRVVIPPGIYRGQAPFIEIKDASDIEIIAEGVVMLCETRVRALQITNCKNLTLKGLTIDYNPLTFTQGEIVNIVDDYVDVKIHEGYPKVAHSRIDIIDPKTRFRKRGSIFVWGAKAQMVGDDVVRVFQKDLSKVAEIGDLATMSGGAENGPPHALVMEYCRGGIVLDGVSVYAAPGFGILEAMGDGGTLLKNCAVVPGPKPEGATQERLLSASWDAIQHKLLYNGPIVENCIVKDAGDDSWSVTSDGNFALENVDGNRIQIRKHMTSVLQPGDTLRTSLHSEYAVVERKTGDMLLLDRNCPWKTGTRVYTPNRRCEHFIFRNNNIRSSGRVLVKASNGIIENNMIEDGHCGVVVSSEQAQTAISNIIIRNNTFSGSGGHFMPAPWSNGAGSVSVSAGSNNVIDPVGAYENITIENNSFADISGVNIVVTSAKNVKITENRFYQPGITTPNNTGASYGIDQNTVVYLKNIDTVVLDNNAVENRKLDTLSQKINLTNLIQLNGGIFDNRGNNIGLNNSKYRIGDSFSNASGNH